MEGSKVFVIRLIDGLTAPCDVNYFVSCGAFAGEEQVISYNNLRGARRFGSEAEARAVLENELSPGAQRRHKIEQVPPLQLLYFPPYNETAEMIKFEHLDIRRK